MKTVVLALLSVLMIAFYSCSKKGLMYKNDYDKSYQAWLDFKDSSHNSYRYMVVTGSWTGYNTETVITVKNGQVTERSFSARLLRNNSGSVTDSLLTQWNENTAQLSSHVDGAPSLTLDEVYKEAKENWLRKRDDADTYFEAKNNGKLSSCGYVPHNCADDCFIGIVIRYIEAI